MPKKYYTLRLKL